MKRASFRDILFVNAYWVGLSFMWNSLHVIILPAVLLHLVPETLKNTYLGLLTFFGLILAMAIQPVSGAISDRWISAWGRRRPLILLGTLFDFVFLVFLGWAGGLMWVAIGYIGLQISSNVAHGPLQGLLPDVVPEEQLGRASGVKNFMDMIGLVAASLLVGHLLDPDVRHPVGVMSLVAAVLAVGASVTLLGVREKPALSEGSRAILGAWRESLRVNLRAHRAFVWLCASRFLYLIGIYGVQSFAQYYVRDVLAVANPVQLTGDLLAIITLALIFFSLLGGWLGDRFGHLRMSVFASLFGFLGCTLMIWARTPQTLLAFGSLFGVGIGLFLTANWAMANELAPQAEAGKFMGLTNLATAGAAAVGRLEGPLIDALNNARPGAWLGYAGLFMLGAICVLGSAILLYAVRGAQAQAPAQSV
jgi:MFS family permease